LKTFEILAHHYDKRHDIKKVVDNAGRLDAKKVETVLSTFDCCQCGRCCKLEWVQIRLGDGSVIGGPCPNLNKCGECNIYENRPSDCKAFPQCERNDILNLAIICPVVFWVLSNNPQSLGKTFDFKNAGCVNTTPSFWTRQGTMPIQK
jgi:Fe-S-cluster containining protein